MKFADQIPDDWRAVLAESIESTTFMALELEISRQRARTDAMVYPPEDLVFNPLRLTPLTSVKAVILGQDPYLGAGQAHGLSFSVPAGVAPPPSLRNILTGWEADLHLPSATSGSLEPWARHGVLLLNTVMTVRQGRANSHKGMGWEPFTDAIVRVVAANLATATAPPEPT